MSRVALQKESIEDYKKYCEKNGKYAIGYVQWLRRDKNSITLRRKIK